MPEEGSTSSQPSLSSFFFVFSIFQLLLTIKHENISINSIIIFFFGIILPKDTAEERQNPGQ
jgi:hypothetical protein